MMTSNIGAPLLIDGIDGSEQLLPSIRQKVKNELKVYFRLNFLNRVDEIIVFNPHINYPGSKNCCRLVYNGFYTCSIYLLKQRVQYMERRG